MGYTSFYLSIKMTDNDSFFEGKEKEREREKKKRQTSYYLV